MILRPVRDDEEDAEVVRVIASAAFGASHELLGGAPQGPLPAAEIAMRHSTTRHLARSDPGGCWLIEDGTAGPVGVALSTRREGTWGLSLLAVVPGAQGKGVGKALLARALVHGRACLRGIICGSRHPVAARTYRRAGFTLHPAMRLTGPVDAAGLKPPDGAVHEGTARHRDLLDSLDRRTRGGAHGADHEELLRHHRLFVVDDLAGSGYCYLRGGSVELIAATSRRLASRLLTAALLSVPEGETARVDRLTAEQDWALDVGIAAGLEITNAGFVCLRGMRPPMPYIPSRTFL
ncbi:GNAT family N-acetyltransferase [Streptomyces sp. CBMA29]|uniref:GNAT family N-acetyltransferase n=1 Tax=Streptomyces sp. CBMA29 TaxID=1896314 RepID=UPI001661C338|nr:GNAT family N-acetyltransferase [Streptomyces sp. CBMA29]MBD0736141.1 GNAT family N-acetyltransferase [Streptomyces sp. CBMA29]